MADHGARLAPFAIESQLGVGRFRSIMPADPEELAAAIQADIDALRPTALFAGPAADDLLRCFEYSKKREPSAGLCNVAV